MPIENIIFDLDGTLVDSIPGIEYACQCAVASVCPHRTLRYMRSFIGPPIDVILSRLFPDIHKNELELLVKEFRSVYDSDGWRKTTLFDGVMFTLKTFRQLDIRIYLVTSKPKSPTEQILDFLNIRHHFLDVVCPDSIISWFSSKTDTIDYLFEKHGLDRKKSFYVGDTNDDLIAAKSTGIGFIYASYGYGRVTEKTGDIAYQIESVIELIKIVEREKR